MCPQPQLSIDNKYFTQFKLSSSKAIDCYRVKDADKQNYFLKLYRLEHLSKADFAANNQVLEIEILKQLSHSAIVRYHDSGKTEIEGKSCAYLVTEYISGESLADLLRRKTKVSTYDTIIYAIQCLEALAYLQDLPEPIIHNALNPEHLIVDSLSLSPRIKVAGFRYARYLSQPRESYQNQLLNPYFIPDEGFDGAFSAKSDFFAVGGIIYNLIYGIPPWYVDSVNLETRQKRDLIKQARSKPLQIISSILGDLDTTESLMKIMDKALQTDPFKRYSSAIEFIQELRQELSNPSQTRVDASYSATQAAASMFDTVDASLSGFAAIAGMDELKDILTHDVINIFRDPEGAQEYGLSIPNGMLLFGPPGCGKTYIAEKLAEEVDFRFYFIKASDLASPYIFDTQRKTGELFKEALQNKPSIICFDEFDSYAFKKSTTENASMVGAVNEILSQLNNCGKKGVFVIATTNYPELIEESILRKGRMDLIIYVSPPDLSARKGLFELYLQNKPVDFSIDCDELARKTDRFVASDIEFIVTSAAREAYRNKLRITQASILNLIAQTSPSVSPEDLEKYARLKDRFDRQSKEQKPKTIGFRQSEDEE